MFDSQNNQFLGADTNGAQAQPFYTSPQSWLQVLSDQQNSNSQGSAQTTPPPSLADDALTRDWKSTMKNNYTSSLGGGDPLDGVAEAKLVAQRATPSTTATGEAVMSDATGTAPPSGAPEQPNQSAAAQGNGNGSPQNTGRTQLPEAPKSTMRPDLGESVKQYESGTDGPSSIAPDNSYGSYQITASTMPEFLSSPEAQKYVPAFTGLKPGTPAFNAKWKEIAANDPEGLHQAEKAFIYRTRYLPKSEIAKQYGFDVSNPAIQDAIWSGSIQHSGFAYIIGRAASGANVSNKSVEEQIRALYAARTNYAKKRNVRYSAGEGRYIKEVQSVLNRNTVYYETNK